MFGLSCLVLCGEMCEKKVMCWKKMGRKLTAMTRQRFLDGYGPPLWLEHQLERQSLEPRVERSGIGYVSVLEVDDFLDTVVGKL